MLANLSNSGCQFGREESYETSILRKMGQILEIFANGLKILKDLVHATVEKQKMALIDWGT